MPRLRTLALLCGGCGAFYLLVPALAAADPLVALKTATDAAAAATEPELEVRLTLQAALLARIVGVPATAERLVKNRQEPELRFLRHLLQAEAAPRLPFPAKLDAVSSAAIERWLRGELSCRGQHVDPLFCAGLP